MANTTNFGWETPDDTDLVKDGAAAIRTLGSAIDTSLVDLKGGTTGQILSKTSNTDMDFTWITNDQGDITAVSAGTGLTGGGTSGAVTLSLDTTAVIQPTIVDAKGDIIAATAADTVSRLAVGANNTVLTADSSTATGLKWATVNAGAYTELASGSFSGSNLSLTSISASYKDLRVLIRGIRGSAGESPRIRFNNDTTNGNYRQATNLGALASSSAISFAPEFITGGSTIANINIDVLDYTNTSTHKPVWARSYYQDGATPSYRAQINQGAWLNTGAINRIDIFFDSGNSFTGGTYILYGVN